jgi:hypothetical protein
LVSIIVVAVLLFHVATVLVAGQPVFVIQFVFAKNVLVPQFVAAETFVAELVLPSVVSLTGAEFLNDVSFPVAADLKVVSLSAGAQFAFGAEL